MPLAKMKEELTCPICLELFSHPRRLPCGHSYCHSCIEAMVEKHVEHTGYYYNYSRVLVCPECREEINFDYVRGIEGIPTDFKLSKLVELFQFLKTKDDNDSCEETQQHPASLNHQQLHSPEAVSSSSQHFVPPDQTAAVAVHDSQVSGQVESPSPSHVASTTVGSAESWLTRPSPSSAAGPVTSGDEPHSDSALGAVGGLRRTTDIKNNVGLPCPVNVPDFVVQHIYSSSPCVAGVNADTVHAHHLSSDNFHNSNHHDRAHSVPIEVQKLQSTSIEKRKKSKKRNWKSLFAYDSSSTDSSSSDSQISETSWRSAGAKNKQWLMTRFLKSVIFSDSSSSEDDEETAIARTGSAHQLNVTDHQVDSSTGGNTSAKSLKFTSGQRNPSEHEQSVNNLSDTTTYAVLSSDGQVNGQNLNLDQLNLSTATSGASGVSSNSSATLVKKPACVERPAQFATERAAALDALTIPKRIAATNRYSLPEPAENQPTLYDNYHSQVGHHPLISQYDNIQCGTERLAYGVPVTDLVHATHAPVLHPLNNIQLGPRTFYDNVSDSELKFYEGGPSSPVIVNRSASPQNHITEIESLKTGFESVTESPLNSTSSFTRGAASSGFTYQRVCSPAELGEQRNLPATSVQASEGHESHYDNMNTSGTNQIESLKMSQENHTSPPMVLTTTPDAELEPETGFGQFHHVYGQVIRTDDDFEFDENYFDTSAEEVSERDLSHLNLAPSSFAIDGGEASFSRSSTGASLVKSGAENVAHSREGSNSKSESKNDKVDNSSEDEEEDDGSHSGTSMLQNKKKPRSRLKKFLTSLLSLSSSDDEDEHYDVRTSSSSKSSDW